MEVSAGGERWCRLVMVVRGVGGLRWRCELVEVRADGVRWRMLELVV